MSKATNKINTQKQPLSSSSSSSSRRPTDEDGHIETVICPTTPDKCQCSGPCVYNNELIRAKNKDDLLKMCSLYVLLEKKDHHHFYTMADKINQCIDAISESLDEWDGELVCKIVVLVQQMEKVPCRLESAIETLSGDLAYKSFIWA
jgi:poly(A) polymerase Pap1